MASVKVGHYRFAPPWWGVVLALLVASLLAALGVWQIHRAQYKERLVAAEKAAEAAGPTPLDAAAAAASANKRPGPPLFGRHYYVRGRFDAEQQILLNDQIHGQRRGYRVWTPLVMSNGARVMVDRGWIPRPAEAAQRPPNPDAPRDRVRVLGYWQEFPRPALDFGATGNGCSGEGWPRALNYPEAATVACQYDAPVARGLLLLDPEADGGFVRDWDEDRVGLGPMGHYAYASQWFLMGLVALGILVVVNTRRDADD